MRSVLFISSIVLNMSTSRKATLAGSAENAVITLWTQSYLNARDMKISNVQITEETLCEADLNVSEKLSARLFRTVKSGILIMQNLILLILHLIKWSR